MFSCVSCCATHTLLMKELNNFGKQRGYAQELHNMTVLIQGQVWLPSLAKNIADLCDTGLCKTLFTQNYILLSTVGYS